VESRKYSTFHHLDVRPKLVATVDWNGQHWTVTVDDEVLPDCCATIEEAFSVAEQEIARRFPDHSCHQRDCRAWQTVADATE
jgi:hypothetical protein